MAIKVAGAGLVLSLYLAGCAHMMGHNSGEDYSKSYDGSYDAVADRPASLLWAVDADISHSAALEPPISFPARIGVARIAGGQLTDLPAKEAAAWARLQQQMDDRYGELVPVSPLIASMVATSAQKGGKTQNKTWQGKEQGAAIMDHIRRGAARQHLDYVVVYEILDHSDVRSNILALTDVTVLGLFIMPSRQVKMDVMVSAILVDVRNGYPYGTASTYAEASAVIKAADSQAQKQDLQNEARLKAVDDMVVEFEMLLHELRDEAYAQKLAMGY